MIDGLLQDLAVKAKARTGVSEELMIWGIVIAMVSVIAVVFLSVAGYMWLADLYGGAIAAAVVGCFHALVAAGALARCIIIRRRTKAAALAAMKVTEKESAWWADPGVLAVGLEVAKIIGWRKLAPFVTAGVLAATLGGKRGARKSRTSANGAN